MAKLVESGVLEGEAGEYEDEEHADGCVFPYDSRWPLSQSTNLRRGGLLGMCAWLMFAKAFELYL